MERRKTLIAALLMVGAASCRSDVVRPAPDGGTADVMVDAARDEGVRDTGTRDSDGVADSAKTPDTVEAVDVAVPDVAVDVSPDAPDVCTPALAQLLLEQSRVLGCERPSECGVRYTTTCLLAPCYHFYNLSSDLSAVRAAEEAWRPCEEVDCDCGPPAGALTCVDGSCSTCPLDCSYACDLNCECHVDACGCDQPWCQPTTPETCAETRDRISEAAADLRGCSTDADCFVDTSPLCPEVGCHFARNRNGHRGELDLLVEDYVGGGCNLQVCACTQPPTAAFCSEGLCEGVAP